METITYIVRFNLLTLSYSVDVEENGQYDRDVKQGNTRIATLQWLRRDIRHLEQYDVPIIELDHSVTLDPDHEPLETFAREVNVHSESLIA